MQAFKLGELAHGIGNLLLVLHVELYLFVRVIRNNVLMRVIVHFDEITKGNFIVSLSAGEYAGEELVGGAGRRQGSPSRARGHIS